MMLPPFRIAISSFLALSTTLSNAADAPPKVVQQFLGKYCLECHDADVQKGDRSFEKFELPLKGTADLIEARDIIDQLTLKEMPPKKADQPSDEERIAMIRALRDGTVVAYGKLQSTGSRTVMRRLSSREYENTLAVLFGRRVDTLGLTADFPKEKTTEHMDTIGKSLVTSGFLVDQYFQSANRLVETRLGKPATPPKDWKFNGHFVQYEELQRLAQKRLQLPLPQSLRAAEQRHAPGRLRPHRGFPQRRARLRSLRPRSRGHRDASRHALRSHHLRHRLLGALRPRRRAR
jgi:hypothetical protein